MPTASDLQRLLHSLDGRGYGGYKQIAGTWDLGSCRLVVDTVQVDPFAPPSRVRLVLDGAVAGLPAAIVDDAEGRVATGDFLMRGLAAAIDRIGAGAGPERLTVGTPGQAVLERTNVVVTPPGPDGHRTGCDGGALEARLLVGLPAAGRRVRGRDAARLLTETLPRLAERALEHRSIDSAALAEHVRLYRDVEWLRRQLAGAGLVAFVGDEAILPRRAGDSDLPMVQGAVPFASPESLRVSFDLPSGRRVTGMGVREGVTVVVGGGYHGKSTLLRALERGVYAHVGGDGREWVVTRRDAVAIRAEDGRAVTDVDISPFITNLPSGQDTRRFTTTNASGSTSQAANLVEAVESGSRALLIDEDTSATNFMIRDERMRLLIPADREPITPFVERVQPLLAERGVSTVLVAGGSGAFFDVADTVLALDAYVLSDVTERAHALASDARGGSASPPPSTGSLFRDHPTRVPAAGALDPRGTTKPARSRGRGEIQLGRETIDVALVSQLIDQAQTEAIARALGWLAARVDGRTTLVDMVNELDRRIDEGGLDGIAGRRGGGHPGHLARPRPQEVLAAVNRYRLLRTTGRG